jgi:hypothetical protein
MEHLPTFNEFVNEKAENYMTIENLKTIKRNVEILLAMDPIKIDEILKNGHDWAEDHISVANENLDQVTKFFTNEQ